tara:strand:- start:584 stop:1180 length:597 start_codon:yes stop_codon:yes gene_type:complete
MSINYKVNACERNYIKPFIEKWHYSKSINGLHGSYYFSLTDDCDEIIGAIIYGKLGMASVWTKYGKKENDVIELNRLCCIDDTKKNTESYFISRTIKWLKKNTDIKVIVSYADPEYGHRGIVYKATHFTQVGKTKKGKVIMFNGKKYHDKTIRTRYKGELKPYAEKIKQALENGKAFYKETKPKFIYIYEIRDTKLRR